MEISIHFFMHLPSADDALRDQLEKISQQLNQTERTIMTAISDYAAKQQAFNAELGNAIDGIAADIAELNTTITTLQGTQGPVTAEDQALLDQAEAQSAALVDRIKAVDALTPPVVPVTPATPAAL
jgi:chromosome segregation ATPase